MRLALLPVLALAGCAATDPLVASASDPVVYDGVETRLLDGDLVSFVVRTSGGTTLDVVNEYAECAAAQYTLIRGYSFARLIRTNITTEGRSLVADAVYTISPDLPRGSRTIDAEVTVANCGESGIPTV